MSYYSNLFKAARKVAKKSSSSIADLGTNFFSKGAKTLSSSAKSARKSISNIQTSSVASTAKNSLKKTKPNTAGRASKAVTPEIKNIKSVGGLIGGKNAKRLLGGAALGGGAAFLGLGLKSGGNAVRDVFDPLARQTENVNDYLDALIRGKNEGVIDDSYTAGDGSLIEDSGELFSGEEEGGSKAGLVIAGLAAAGLGAYFLMKKKKSKKGGKK